ncbi:hypothetical protein [Geotalea uraniireducens]|nr:hypothetical protein [Geotalea uraniireducens]
MPISKSTARCSTGQGRNYLALAETAMAERVKRCGDGAAGNRHYDVQG